MNLMLLLSKIIRNISSIILIFPLTIIQMLYLLFYLLKKKNIFIYHHGWGVGHTLHDVEYFRKTYVSKETAVIFFNNGKHNILLSDSFTDISVRFIKIFVYIPFLKKNLTFHNKISFLLHDLFVFLIKFFYGTKKNIKTIAETREEIMINKNISYNQIYRLMEPDYNNANRKPLILPDYIKNRVENKIKKILNIKIENKKIFTIYIRYKGTDDDSFHELVRSSSELKEYFPIFDYLIDKKFLVFLYGDYLFKELQNYKNYKSIITNELLGLDRNSVCLYSSLSCNYFIGNSGGGAYFPFSRKIPPKTLILNAMPFDFALPNATVVYKNAIDKKGNLIEGEKLLNNFSKSYNISGYKIIANTKTLMLESLIDFLHFYDQHNSQEMNREKLPKLSKNSIHSRYNLRISPVWLKYNSN